MSVIPTMTRAQLQDQSRSSIGWGLGLAAVAGIYVGFYPAFAGDAVDVMVAELPDAVVEAFGYDRMGTPEGWLTSTIHGLLGPVLLLVAGIASGARAIAGDEEAGLLDIDVVSGASRHRVAAERMAAVVVRSTGLVIALTGAVWLVANIVGMEIGLVRLIEAGVMLGAFVGAFALLAAAIGAATGRRVVAVGIPAALVVGGWVLHVLAPLVDAAWMTVLSPFAWYAEAEPVATGIDGGVLMRFVTIAVVAAVIGIRGFAARDVGR